MALFKVDAYKCEWCGRLFDSDRNHHASECKYDPKARTCVSCVHSGELKRQYNGCEPKATGVYCPRADEVFLYPHDKYCSDYEKTPEFESYKEQGQQ